MKSQEVKESFKKFFLPSVIENGSHFPAYGKGSYYTDIEGMEYLDFTAGIGTNTFGHGDKEIAEVLKETYLSLNNIHNRLPTVALELCEQISGYLPLPDYCFFFFGDGGGYTVDRALTVLYDHFDKKRYRLASFAEGFHGKTQAANLAISKTEDGAYFSSVQIPAPHCFHCPCNKCKETCELECAELAEQILADNEIQVFLIEPVLGSAVIVPPEGYWKRIQDFCHNHNILIIDDEVFMGGGRSGNYFTGLSMGITPDVIVMTKGLAAGLPCSMLLIRSELTNNQYLSCPGYMNSTFSNLPVVLSVANVVLKKIKQEKILENVNNLNKVLVNELQTLKESFSNYVGDVRSIGLFGAIEFHSFEFSQQVFNKAELLGLETINSGSVLRIAPPLNITKEDLIKGFHILKEAIRETVLNDKS